MTVCKKCNGTGEIIVPVVGTMLYGKQQCDECNGTGEVNMTNEEWFNGLSTIEKAKALHKLHWEMQNHFDYSPDDEDYVEEYCLCWLKAVHRDD